MKTLTDQYSKKFYVNEKYYNDTVDMSFDISLYEYGIVRSAKTNKTIIGINGNDYGEYIDFNWTYITLQDVKEVLKDIEDSFFSFTGIENKEEYINNLDNENLAHDIRSINQYNGWFNLY